MDKLKPCAFHGEKREVNAQRYAPPATKDDTKEWWRGECLMCESMGPWGNDELEAIEAWNERAKENAG